VDLAEDHVPRARGALEQLSRRDEGRGARVPEFPDERMLLDLVGAGDERRRCERDQKLLGC
jgi:hypothetical protein